MGFLPFFSLESWLLLITFVCIFVMYGSWTFGVFEKLGIPCAKPVMYWGTLTRQNKVYYLADVESFQKYGRIWGVYELRTPVLAVMDPDMLKTILVKEFFTYFTNRRNLRLNGDLYDSVSLVEDDHWRRIRHIFSPVFTSGHIKEMFSIMKHHSHKLTNSLQSKAQNGEVIDIKQFFGPYSIDVMGSCAFSVDMDTLSDPSCPLMTHASKLFRFSTYLFLLQGFFPFLLPLLELLDISFFSKSSTAYFKNIFDKIKAERSDSSKKNATDVLQHMINSHNPETEKQNEGLTEHEIFTQTAMFVMGGYETNTANLVLLAYCLATNPDVMKRLQKEIDSTFPNKSPVQYEALMQMEYLDCVFNECLRLYPPIARLERMAKESVKINGITIPKGMLVMVPVYALHRDPELWPEPEKFNPDRFSKENKQHIKPYSFLPFGIGPRNCVGMRFAAVMIKLALVEILQNYSFSVCKETEIPLEMDPGSFVGPLRPIKLKLLTRPVASGGEDEKCN